MHQQPLATEHPRAVKIASTSRHRDGVAGRMMSASFIDGHLAR
jgi:hypothetical protein